MFSLVHEPTLAEYDGEHHGGGLEPVHVLRVLKHVLVYHIYLCQRDKKI